MINFKVKNAFVELKNALKEEDCSFSDLRNAAHALVDVMEAEQEEKLREIRLQKEKENNAFYDLKIYSETWKKAIEKEKLNKTLIVDDFEEKTKKYIAEFRKIFC